MACLEGCMCNSTWREEVTTESKRDLLKRGSDHYKKGGIEPIDYIMENELGFCEGCVVKYITRYKLSGTGRKDLNKIKHYVDFLLERLDDGEST